MQAISLDSELATGFEMTTNHPRRETLMDSWGMTSNKQALDQDKVFDSGTESESGLEDNHLSASSES